MYVFSKGLIKISNRKFTSIPNEYGITFGLDADIKEVSDTGLIKKDIGFKFVTIKEIAEMTEVWTIDCVGVVLNAETPILIRLRTGGEKKKRTILIADDSEKPNGMSINFCLWGELTEMNIE